MAFDAQQTSAPKEGRRSSRISPSMNVTPLVDVVLVLLIIFMVVTPLLTKQFWVRVPEKPDEHADRKPEPRPDNTSLVLRVAADGTYAVNDERLSEIDLPEKLRRMFAARTDNVLFFDADDTAPYGAAAHALDLARQGGALTIAVLTETLLQTQALSP